MAGEVSRDYSERHHKPHISLSGKRIWDYLVYKPSYSQYGDHAASTYFRSKHFFKVLVLHSIQFGVDSERLSVINSRPIFLYLQKSFALRNDIAKQLSLMAKWPLVIFVSYGQLQNAVIILGL